MNAYLALIRIYLKLALREKGVLFFNYVFPLIFFFGFGQLMGAQLGGTITRLVSMVLVIGMLGNGLFGAGLRSVMDREMNILRRYKVTPISPLPILVASTVSGWLLYLPAVLLVLVLAKLVYGMPFPDQWLSLLVLVSVGLWAFRALGLIIASVANSVAESNILIQLLYMPMLFLSGATFPITVLPLGAQITAQFLPASYVHSGVERILVRSESLAGNLTPLGALLVTTAVSLFISMKIFRWEKDEVIRRSAKLWLAAALVPFIGLGGWQAYSHDQINQSKQLDRAIRRSRSRLIRGARIFVGDGRVIESGAVLVRNGKIAQVWEGAAPDAKDLRAELIEGAGKTLLPGLIDVHVHLGSPGGILENPADYASQGGLERSLAAYLYCGVTAVKSAGDFLTPALAARRRIGSGERLGAEFFLVGPLFTAKDGHPAAFLKNAPRLLQSMGEREFTRLPATAEEARRQVGELKVAGVDGIKGVLEAGAAGMLFPRMDVAVLRAVGEEARARKLPLVVHTGDARDIADALEAGAVGVEHGSFREPVPEELFARMARQGVAYSPTLSVVEAFGDLGAAKTDLLARSLVEQVAPPGLLPATRRMLASAEGRALRERLARYPVNLEVARENLRRAHRAGALLVTGSDAGNPMILHGPTVHRELTLWVEAGIPPKDALRAATGNAARLLGTDQRVGFIRPGFDATLLLVDGNPLAEIAATERISMVMLQGERVDRAGLFDQK